MNVKNDRKQRESGHRVRGSGLVIGTALLGYIFSTMTVFAASDTGVVISAAPPLAVEQQANKDVSLNAGMVAGQNKVDLGTTRTTELIVTPDTTQAVAIPPQGDVSLSAADGEPAYQVYAVSAAIKTGYELPGGHGYAPGATQRVAEDNPEGAVSGNSSDEQPLSYALVLALIALIGLVPVSRRNH
jgi:hypothetical protein